MISVKLLAMAAVAVTAGIGAVINAIWGPRARARRRLERGSRLLAEGEIVTLVGKARVIGEGIVAPLSGRRCAAYEAIGRMRGTHGETTGELREVKVVPFELVTSDVTVIVDGDHADFALPLIPLIPRKLEREQEFMEAHGRSGFEAATSGFDEVVVEDGDKIVVQGMAVVTQLAEGETGYRDSPTRVRIVAYAGHPITIGKPR